MYLLGGNSSLQLQVPATSICMSLEWPKILETSYQLQLKGILTL